MNRILCAWCCPARTRLVVLSFMFSVLFVVCYSRIFTPWREGQIARRLGSWHGHRSLNMSFHWTACDLVENDEEIPSDLSSFMSEYYSRAYFPTDFSDSRRITWDGFEPDLLQVCLGNSIGVSYDRVGEGYLCAVWFLDVEGATTFHFMAEGLVLSWSMYEGRRSGAIWMKTKYGGEWDMSNTDFIWRWGEEHEKYITDKLGKDWVDVIENKGNDSALTPCE